MAFWRLRPVDGAAVSPTWQLHVGAGNLHPTGDLVQGTVSDVDGDGIADLVVGAPLRDRGRGSVLLHPGAIGGFAERREIEPPHGFDVGSFGRAVSSAGDVNGDGFGDMVVGAPNPFGDQDGAAFIYLGGEAGPARESVVHLRGPFGSRGQFGAAVASAGDVDGDGYGDLLVGAWASRSGDGAVYIYRGGTPPLVDRPQEIIGPSGQASAFGRSVAPLGDVDGDGYDDVAIGADGGDGRVYVYRGGPSGLNVEPWQTLQPTAITGSESGFGAALAVGDFDGDGLVDLAVGAPREQASAGAVYVFRGQRIGFVDEALRFGSLDGGGAGESLRAGDLNADGRADLIVGAPGTVVATSDGAVHLLFGAATILVQRDVFTGPVGAESRYGRSLTTGDFDGDGVIDVLVGAPFMNDNDGSVFFHRGAVGGPRRIADVLRGPGSVASMFGTTLAWSIGRILLGAVPNGAG
ncbi:MAG: FG-GAP repeat protein [Sandaracinaceae bacterium]|nr:FG-GAP repeat protein [Sandaracinaceae bacterium]